MPTRYGRLAKVPCAEIRCTIIVQVRVMTALRHPNVVLFMAASTKAPKMCIVMEYMALGSLFDVLCSLPLPP